MLEKFQKHVLFDNIAFLLKESGLRIGEFEAETGVSAGYISRTCKDDKTKPGIDFIMNAAAILNVSIDVLLKHNLTTFTETDIYLISFLSKLLSDTLDNRLEWNRETAEYLNHGLKLDAIGTCLHPLFAEKTFFEKGELIYPNEVTKIVFTSDSFGTNTCIEDDCFNIHLSENAILYLMKISKNIHDEREEGVHSIEVWMSQNGVNTFLCSTKGVDGMTDAIQNLYTAVKENEKQPKIRENVKNVIDAYMQGNALTDEEIEDIPW